MGTPRTPRTPQAGAVFKGSSRLPTGANAQSPNKTRRVLSGSPNPPRSARSARSAPSNSPRLAPISARSPPKTARSNLSHHTPLSAARTPRSPPKTAQSQLPGSRAQTGGEHPFPEDLTSKVRVGKTRAVEPVRHFDQGEECEVQGPAAGGDAADSQPDVMAKVHSIGLCLKKIFEQKSVRRMFRDWDKNFDGQLDVDEFCEAVGRHGFQMKKDEVEMLMRYLDDDYDGNIRYNEFQHLMEERLESGKYKSAEVRYALDRSNEQEESTMRPPTSTSEAADEYMLSVLPAGGNPRMLGGAFATAHPGQWRLPSQWVEQPFPEPLRKFQKMIRSYVDPRPNIREVFREWDKGHDGFLDWEEFYDGLLAIDFSQLPPKEELKKLFLQLDASDGVVDGKIDFNAFRLLTKPDIKDPQSTVRPRTGEINGLPVLPKDHYHHLHKKNEPHFPLFDAKGAIKALNDKFVDRKTSMEMFMLFNWNPNPLEPKEAMMADDFRRGLSMLNIHLADDEFEKMWTEIDADGSGELDYYEFLDAFYPTDTIEKVEAPEVEEMDMDEAFEMAEAGSKKPLVNKVMQRFGQKFSSNKKAFRDLKEPTMAVLKSEDLHKLLQTTTYGLSKEQADEVLQHADQSGDGYIDYAEFCNTMMPQERNRKGNPMELLRTNHSSFKQKRERTTDEFTLNAVPFAQSFGAAATGGRYGFSWKNNRNFTDTFRSLRPDSNSAPNQFLEERARLSTTQSAGLMQGYGGVKDHRSTLSVRKYHNEDRIMREFDRLDEHLEDRKANRVKNIYNRRMLYVNTLHHDKRNAPRLACRFNHG